MKTRTKKGVIIVLLVLLLIPMLGLASFIADVAVAYTFKARIKNAIDFGALAGISELEDSSYFTYAKSAAVNFINNNLIQTIPGYMAISLGDSNLTIQGGIYDLSAMTFTYDELSSNANALSIQLQYNIETNFASIFMINSIPISLSTIAAKQVAGAAAPKTLFPLVIDTAALPDAAINSNMLDLYQSGGSKNSFFTAFDGTGGAPEILDIFYFWAHGDESGVTPPATRVSDGFKDYNGNVDNLYINIPEYYLIGNTYIFALSNGSNPSGITLEGFLGARIDAIDVSNHKFSITILPGHIDNAHKGLKIDNGVRAIDPADKYLLANSFGIVM